MSAFAELFWCKEKETQNKAGLQIGLSRAQDAADFDRQLYLAVIDRAAQAPRTTVL